ncbi:MAG: AzlC family ABC transporter permease [Pseudomonadota bacterium]
MSAFIFAGASQFLALEIWQQPLPLVTLIIAVLVVNLRHILMGAAMLPWFQQVRPSQAYFSLFFMTDESWGTSVRDMENGGRDAAFLLGAGLTLYVVWVSSTLLGRLGGDLSDLIATFGLEFLTTAFFVALLAGFWRGRRDLLPWLVAAAVALATQAFMGGTWHILFGALAGSLFGALRHLRRRG